jgi:hypothetical protein
LVGAFNAEMGLEAPDPDMLAAVGGARITTPSGMVLDGSLDAIESPPVSSPMQDSDNDGHVNEIPVSIVDHEEFYLLHYFKAGIGRQSTESTLGRIVFNQIGCTSCHQANLTIDRDRRVADLETNYDAAQGNPFNHMFTTAVPKFVAVDDRSTDRSDLVLLDGQTLETIATVHVPARVPHGFHGNWVPTGS